MMEEQNLVIAYGSQHITLNKGEQHITLSKRDLAFIVESAIRNNEVEISFNNPKN
jgi:hypothetical protein